MHQTKVYKDYLEKEEQLYMKKERLFNEGKVSAWNLKPGDLTTEIGLTVQTNPEIAMKLILPKVNSINSKQETEKLKEQFISCGYYTNKLLEEARYLMVKNYRTMRKHFKTAANDYATIMKTVSYFISVRCMISGHSYLSISMQRYHEWTSNLELPSYKQ